MHKAAQRAYAAGNIEPLNGKTAMNFLLDRSAANWGKALAELKAEVGECPTAGALSPTGAMSASFRWSCERGKLDGQLLLAPTKPMTIQSLRLRVVMPTAK
jgi:hypothetical protein